MPQDGSSPKSKKKSASQNSKGRNASPSTKAAKIPSPPTQKVNPLSVAQLGQQCAGRVIDRSEYPRFPVSRQSSTVRSCAFANGSAAGSNNNVSSEKKAAEDGEGTSPGIGGSRKGCAGTSTASPRVGSCIGGSENGRQIPRTKMTTKCLWNACKALSIGLVLLALGCAMATVGYYADQLSESKYLRGNTTYRVKDEWTGFHLNNLSYAGPIIMGVGGFIIVAACVMTFEARDSAAKVVPARFRLQRPRSPIRRKTQTPAGILPAGVSGSRRSAGSQTRWGDNNEPAIDGPSKPVKTLSPRRQSDVSKLGRVPSGPHQNHQQILQLLARKRREELTSDLTNFSKQPLGAPHAPLKRSPSAPSALHRLHRPPHPPRPPDALLPCLPPSYNQQENTHAKVTRTWSRGSRRQSPLSGGRRQHPVLRRQALSVDQGTAAAARTVAAPYTVHDYPHHGIHDSNVDDGSQLSISGQQSHRRTTTVVCHHESYSPLIGYGSGGDENRSEVKEEDEDEGLPKPLQEPITIDPPTGSGGCVEVVMEPSSLELTNQESPLLGAVGGISEFTDLDVVKPYPEPSPVVTRVRPMLSQRARSETARRHLLTRQKPVNTDGNG